jgi:predicted dehydrogenase
MHAHGYAHAATEREDILLTGVWDHNPQRASEFARKWNLPVVEHLEALLEQSDAVIITSENRRHAEYIERAVEASKHILCEKPLATSEDEARRIRTAVQAAKITFMTSFPCRLSPVYQAMRARIQDGAIGAVLALCGTNHGVCPFDWFVEPAESGGGALMDHVVHVADLMRDLLGESPDEVYAQVNSLRLNLSCEDTAFLHLAFPSGVFATLDGSWSRPSGYKTWGDVRLSATGERGVVEADLFAQALDLFVDDSPTHREVGYGTSLDRELLAAFAESVLEEREPPITMDDGLAASAVAIAAMQSARTGEPATVPQV